MNEIEILQSKIEAAQQILISTHVGPDGDAVGSSLGLWHYLNNIGKKATIVVPTEYPAFLNWLPAVESILVHSEAKEECEKVAANADLIFCLDYNETKRTAKFQTAIDDSDAYKVLIDHHIGEPTWQDLNLSVVGASSTCELVFDVLHRLESNNDFLTKEIAYSLYTGLLTDTGNFQFSATTPRVHHVAAELMAAGVEADIVHNHINNSFSENRLKFFGFCIAKKMKIVPEKNLSYMFISLDEMQEYNIVTGGTEGLVNEPMKINGIDVSVLFKEDKDKIKISFRSKRDIDVSAFSRSFFEGGGHRNAAGGVSFLSWEETEANFLKNLTSLAC
ncbi:MAG: DHH family phosphoesterase [Chitinophagales bacterium]